MVETGDVVKEASFSVGQGYKMGRPSVLQVRVTCTAHETGTITYVRVGGSVVPVIDGGTILLTN